MLCGWVGSELEINLTTGKIERKESDPRILASYLGGKGLNARILWERVPPEVDPLSPGNLLILSPGAITGTVLPAFNRAVLTYRSPVTGLHSHSAIGGCLGPELKYAGYDVVIITGKSASPVYIYIADDNVQIRDARHLWGKDTWETQDAIAKELGDEKVQMLCLGPAGEKGSFFASIEASGGSSASRTAPGAVMGSKNLKAIVVRGKKDLNVADGARLVEYSEQIMSRTGPLRERWLDNFLPQTTTDLVTLNVWAMSHFSGVVDPEVHKHVKEDLHKIAFDYNLKNEVRKSGCYNCGMGCRWTFFNPDDKHYVTAKCQSFSAFMLHTQIIDFNQALRYFGLCRKYGMDDESLSYTVSFAIDLYRRGILTDADTGGLKLEWGKPEPVFALIDLIIKREGIGDVLANGAYRAAKIIGKGAEEFVYTIKKLEPLPVDFIGRPIYALPQAISDKIDRTRSLNGTSFQIWRWPKKEDREAYLKSVYWGYPEGKDFEKFFIEGYDPTGQKYEAMCQFTAYDDETLSLLDSTGGCYYWQMFLSHPPIAKRSFTADMLGAATGVAFDDARLTDIARRIINTVRSYNLRAGMTRKDDSLPKIFYEKSRTPPNFFQFTPELFSKWIDRYYEIKGWDANGVPTRENLEKLGMQSVADELTKRGILK